MNGLLEYRPCIVDGICEAGENHDNCPSDCPAQTGTAGTGQTTTVTSVPATTTSVSLAATTTASTGLLGQSTGAFGALTYFNAYTLIILLLIIAIVLAIVRYSTVPAGAKPKAGVSAAH